MKINQVLLTVLLFGIFLFISCKKKTGNEPVTPTPVSALAEITTNAVTAITSNSATLNATLTSEGQSAVTLRGFCWSRNPHPTVSDSFSKNAFGPGSFSYVLNGLADSTTYYVRTYATNGAGTAYGNEISFTTLKRPLVLGDIGPAGGYVFYLDGMGGGMEVAPSSSDTETVWGCLNFSISGTSAALGTGQANTTAILNGCSATDIAARLCDNLVVNGYSDWFLPSKDELDSVYVNVCKKNLGGFISYRYWSSTQQTSGAAWWEDIALRNKAAGTKTNVYRVRAVRVFK